MCSWIPHAMILLPIFASAFNPFSWLFPPWCELFSLGSALSTSPGLYLHSGHWLFSVKNLKSSSGILPTPVSLRPVVEGPIVLPSQGSWISVLQFQHVSVNMSCVCVCMHVCEQVCLCVCMCLCLFAYIYMCMCVNMCIYPCVEVCVRVLKRSFSLNSLFLKVQSPQPLNNDKINSFWQQPLLTLHPNLFCLCLSRIHALPLWTSRAPPHFGK